MSILLKIIISTMKKQEPFSIGPRTDYVAIRKRQENPKAQLPVAKGVTIQSDTLGGVSVEILTPKKLTSEDIIFYIHGGGYAFGNAFISRGYGSVLADESGMRVCTISYRLAPEHKFPAGPEDCFSVYQELLKKYPDSKIVLAGESGGGTMILVTALMAKDKGIQMPAGICAFSPCTNLADQLSSRTRNKDKDLVVPYENLSDLLKGVYLEEGTDPLNPYVSPYFGDYKGFPPMKVTVDTSEVLFDDSDMLVKKAKEAGVEVEYQILTGTFHSFPTIGRVCPESKKILTETAEFIHKCCSH